MTTELSRILQSVADYATVFVQDSRHLAQDAYLIAIYRGDVRRKGTPIPVEAMLMTSPVIHGCDLDRYVGADLARTLQLSSEGSQHLVALTPGQVMRIDGLLGEQIERELRDVFLNPEWQKLIETKQLFEDMMETRRERREVIPQAWIDKLGHINAQLNAGQGDPGALYSAIVEGHPQFDGAPVLRNLIPIKVSSTAEAERKLFAAQDLYTQMLEARAKAEYAMQHGKSTAVRRKGEEALRQFDNEGVTAEAVEILRNVTLVELQRLAREAEARFGPAETVETNAAKLRKSASMGM